MSLPRLSIARPVGVAMFYLAVVALGILSFSRLPIDLLPDIAYPKLVIYTTYPDVGPSEVERSVTEPIEQAVARVPGVERVESNTRLGISIAAVDIEMREIYINPNAGLTTEECRFVMAHELLHVGLSHHTRRQGRDPYLWNVACDYVINSFNEDKPYDRFIREQIAGPGG